MWDLNDSLYSVPLIYLFLVICKIHIALISVLSCFSFQAGYFSQVRNTKKSSSRLKDALSEDNLAVAMCLAMAQQRYGVVYKETEQNHLKLVGKLYDQCQDALVQFGTFLSVTMSVEEYVAKLPSINSMLADYHIHADVAFFLARPMFTHGINVSDERRASSTRGLPLDVNVK